MSAILRWQSISVILIGVFLHCPAARGDDPAALATGKKVPWLTDLAAAQRDAMARQRPILVRVGGESCAWCKKLEQEIDQPEVQAALARWTLVVLDVDEHSADVRRLAVGPIPALRVLAPTGKVVQARDGYQEGAALVAWLNEQFDGANVAPDPALLASGEPGVADVLRIVRQFDDRDALVREAAIRRLLPYPAVAREPVVGAFREGKLSARLTALELLQAWQAPIERLDPWRPDTFTPEQLAALDTWVEAPLSAELVQVQPMLSEVELELVAAELQQMLDAPAGEVAAIRERIARRGEGVRPLVYQQLQEATTDDQRQRLLTLRYRLAAGGELPLRWPGGLERHASTDARLRHQAADELAKMASSEQQPLLLELFSDPDPLVREISLRGLRNIGGKRATAALVQLLDDPDPNVRAAVLKQLAEDAPAEMLEKIGAYVQQEQDADLVVHAIRYFRELKEQDTSPYVLPLLKHESWQVRAEAAETVAKIIDGHRYGSEADNKTHLTVALLPLLDDPDSFVVSRALMGLKTVADPVSVAALAAAAERHPSLTVEIIRTLTANSSAKTRALPQLRTYLKHENPAVRAAAVRGLAERLDDDSAGYLAAALADTESGVRIAGATSLLEALQGVRQTDRLSASPSLYVPETKSPFGSLLGGLFGGRKKPAMAEPPAEDAPAVDAPAKDTPETTEAQPAAAEDSAWDRWLAELYAGKHRPGWTKSLVEPLQKMLLAENRAERVAAALVLIPLGQAAEALPVLTDNAPLDGDSYDKAIKGLDWLRWPERLALFRTLAAAARDEDQLDSLVYNVDTPPDARFAPEIWTLLDHPKATPRLAPAAERALKASYFGERYYDPSSLTPAQRSRVAAEVKPRAQSGPAAQRLVAVNLLLTVAPDESRAIAQALADDADAPESLRGDAFQILLAALTAPEREREAIAALVGSDASRHPVALKYLALGHTSLARLPASNFEIEVSGDDEGTRDLTPSPVSGFKPIIPIAPKLLKPAHVRALIDSDDAETAAYAGYLSALLGEPAGVQPLLTYWREAKVSDALDRLVYRALAVTDDPQHMDVLRQIYTRMDESDRVEFYWTIRIIGGPEILGFRQEIRKAMGDKLGDNSRSFGF